MEWVFYLAYSWWMVVATIIMTSIFRTSNKQPEPKSIAIKSYYEYERMQTKRF